MTYDLYVGYFWQFGKYATLDVGSELQGNFLPFFFFNKFVRSFGIFVQKCSVHIGLTDNLRTSQNFHHFLSTFLTLFWHVLNFPSISHGNVIFMLLNLTVCCWYILLGSFHRCWTVILNLIDISATVVRAWSSVYFDLIWFCQVKSLRDGCKELAWKRVMQDENIKVHYKD